MAIQHLLQTHSQLQLGLAQQAGQHVGGNQQAQNSQPGQGSLPGQLMQGQQLPGQHQQIQVPGHQLPSHQLPGHQLPGHQLPSHQMSGQMHGQPLSGQQLSSQQLQQSMQMGHPPQAVSIGPPTSHIPSSQGTPSIQPNAQYHPHAALGLNFTPQALQALAQQMPPHLSNMINLQQTAGGAGPPNQFPQQVQYSHSPQQPQQQQQQQQPR